MLKERTATLWAKLVKKYRLVVYDHESLSQSRHLIVKPLSIALLISGAFLSVIGITSVLIYKVPAFHQGIPGFQSHLSEDYMSLQRKNNELEREVAEMDSMLKVFTTALGAGGAKPATNPKVWENSMPEPANVSPTNSGGEEFGQQVQEPIPIEVQGAEPSSSGKREITPRKPDGGLILNLVPPIDGYVTKDFEPKDKPHFGIDLGAEENSLVRSVADGVIVFSEYSNTTGYVVGIWHSKYNLLSFYKHNSRLFKTVGSYVFAGEAIAVIGNTGINSSGTHLHFELWYDNSPVNPADYINFN
jgi:murein DD-endopeptidase MepM/ murein hydrolase activator NlpD